MYTTSSLLDKIKKYTNIAETPELLDMLEDQLKEAERLSACGVNGCIDEAMAQYPAEDFLSAHIDRLHVLSKHLRGNNREELIAIIGAAEDLAQCTFYAAEYGRSELNKAVKRVEGKN